RAVVDGDVVHLREVDDDPVVDAPEARAVVAPAAHGYPDVPVVRELDRCGHVAGVGAVHDRRRMLVDHPVVERTRLVVGPVAAVDHPSFDRRRQPFRRRYRHLVSLRRRPADSTPTGQKSRTSATPPSTSAIPSRRPGVAWCSLNPTQPYWSIRIEANDWPATMAAISVAAPRRGADTMFPAT